MSFVFSGTVDLERLAETLPELAAEVGLSTNIEWTVSATTQKAFGIAEWLKRAQLVEREQ